MAEIYIVKDCYGPCIDETNEFIVGVCSTLEKALELIIRKSKSAKRTLPIIPTVENYPNMDYYEYLESYDEGESAGYAQFYEIEQFVVDQDYEYYKGVGACSED